MTLFPSIVFSTRKRPKRRHSVFLHHVVDKSDVLTKPFSPLETRISSPTELIDLVGHPRLAIKLSSPSQQQGIHDKSKHGLGVTSPPTPLPNQPALDKTLLDVPPSPPLPLKATPSTRPIYSTTRIHYSETLYNTEQANVRHAPPPVLHRRRSSPLPLGTKPHQQQQQQYEGDDEEDELSMLGQDEQDLIQLRQQYDQEQATWRQRLHDYRVREQELMDLLESTRAKLDQLETNAAADAPPPPRPPPLPSDKIQYHHHHHHHHYYYYSRRNRPTRTFSSSSKGSVNSDTKHGFSHDHNKSEGNDACHLKTQRTLAKCLRTYGGLPMPPPPGFWYSPHS